MSCCFEMKNTIDRREWELGFSDCQEILKLMLPDPSFA